jgi:hypothetical protein
LEHNRLISERGPIRGLNAPRPLREKRFNLEVEQSFYFLDIQRVENENNNNQEEQITIPTRTRSLGEDSLLQI